MNATNKRTSFLGEEKISKLLLKISLPAIVGMLVNGLYNVVDTIFVSRGVGLAGIGGLTIAFPIQMFIMALAQMVGIGAASIVSRNLGAGDVEKADQTAGNAYVTIIIFALLTTVLGLIFLTDLLRLFGASEDLLPYAKQYMEIILLGSVFFMFAVSSNNLIRSEGKALVSMVAMLLGTGLNIIFDPLFIFVFDMGIRGAAFATILSQFCSFAFLVFYIYSGKSQLKVKGHHLIPQLPIVKEILVVGSPAFARQVGGSFLAVVLNKSLGIYGGDWAISFFGMSNRLLMLLFMPLFGVMQGLQPIAGYNYGAKKFARVKNVIWVCIRYTCLYMTTGWLVIQIFAPQLINIFTSEASVISTGAPILRLLSLALPFVGIQIVGATVYQAFGKSGPSMFLSLLRQFILLIPMILILPKFLGIWGIWASFPLSDLISTAISAFMLRKEMIFLRMASGTEPSSQPQDVG